MNILRAILGGVKEIDAASYHDEFDNKPHVILDLRNTKEFDDEHIRGAKNIPFSKLKKKLDSLPKDKTLVCVCRDGLRGREAAYMLQKSGFEAANIVGGMHRWTREGEPTV